MWGCASVSSHSFFFWLLRIADIFQGLPITLELILLTYRRGIKQRDNYRFAFGFCRRATGPKQRHLIFLGPKYVIRKHFQNIIQALLSVSTLSPADRHQQHRHQTAEHSAVNYKCTFYFFKWRAIYLQCFPWPLTLPDDPVSRNSGGHPWGSYD